MTMCKHGLFVSSANTSPAHLFIIGGIFILESVSRHTALVHSSEFGGCPLFGSRKCIVSMGIAVRTSMVIHYMQEVNCWEGPLSEVPLYIFYCNMHECIHDEHMYIIFHTCNHHLEKIT